MVETHAHFSKRLTKLNRKHAAMTRGYVNVLTKDGLIVAKPKRPRRNLSGARLILMVVVGFFLFKAFALAAIGPAGYEDRLAALREGTTAEQIGAGIMSADRVTQTLAKVMAPYIR